MKVRRIVANVETRDPSRAKVFYQDILGLEVLLMDHGWISTYGSDQQMAVQISFATEGGAGTAVPGLSIEVDDVDEAFVAMSSAGFDDHLRSDRRTLGRATLLRPRSVRNARQHRLATIARSTIGILRHVAAAANALD
jgi:catechol 2,3-dioxygenase-like lactoylglutathione lyase family enzyme